MELMKDLLTVVEATDSKGKEIKAGQTLIWTDVNGDHTGKVEADPKYNGGLRVGGRSVKNIIDDSDTVKIVESTDEDEQTAVGSQADVNRFKRSYDSLEADMERLLKITADTSFFTKNVTACGGDVSYVTDIHKKLTAALDDLMELHKSVGMQNQKHW